MSRSRKTVLVVMASARRSWLLQRLHECDLDVLAADDFTQALEHLAAGRPLEFVITDGALAGGAWCTLLREARQAGLTPRVLVCGEPCSQPLCGEVVGRGGYYAVEPPHQWRPLWSVIFAPADANRSVVEVLMFREQQASLQPCRSTDRMTRRSSTL